jgi:hypothetical protein
MSPSFLLIKLKITGDDDQFSYAVVSDSEITKKKDSEIYYVEINEKTYCGEIMSDDVKKISSEITCLKPEKLYQSDLWRKFASQLNNKQKSKKSATQPNFPPRPEPTSSETSVKLVIDEKNQQDDDADDFGDDPFYDEASAYPSKIKKKKDVFCV